MCYIKTKNRLRNADEWEKNYTKKIEIRKPHVLYIFLRKVDLYKSI